MDGDGDQHWPWGGQRPTGILDRLGQADYDTVARTLAHWNPLRDVEVLELFEPALLEPGELASRRSTELSVAVAHLRVDYAPTATGAARQR